MQDLEFIQKNIHILKPHMPALHYQAYLNLGGFVTSSRNAVTALDETALKTKKPVFEETARALEEVLQRVTSEIAEEIRSYQAPE